VLPAAFAAAQDCDVFLVVGSSLTVQPAARLCAIAKHNGAGLVIVNADSTRYDRIADAVVPGRIGEVRPAPLGGRQTETGWATWPRGRAPARALPNARCSLQQHCFLTYSSMED
jgi:hypothetical protein